MSVTVQWDNDDKTILRYTFEGDWTWEEYFIELTQGREMMASVSHDVCVFNDMQHITRFPINFVSRAKGVITSRPDNTGLAIFLTTDRFFKILYNILGQIIPNVPTDYLMVATEEEGYNRLYGWLAEQKNKQTNGDSHQASS